MSCKTCCELWAFQNVTLVAASGALFRGSMQRKRDLVSLERRESKQQAHVTADPLYAWSKVMWSL
jgi:hypothetical protein